MVDMLDRVCTRWGIAINGAKTKTMVVGAENDSEQPAITLKDETLEAVEAFSYLGSEVGRTARVDGDVNARLKKAATVYQMWRRKVFRSRRVSRSTKVRVFRVMVCTAVWSRDVGSYPARPQKTTCLPDEILAGHCWSDLVAQEEKCGYSSRDRRNASERPAEV